SLIIGVAAAAGAPSEILIAGTAGLVAGAMSMAAGEYVSVSSQADTEAADMAREQRELAGDPASERAELAAIYIDRGVEPDLARQVADQLMAKDALDAHLRDELGISEVVAAAPVQAAIVSAATFALGAAAPLAVAALAPATQVMPWVVAVSLAGLAVLGGLGAAAGGAGRWRGAVRVLIWGALAMAATAAVGRLFGVVTG
ncbi:MAG: VIT1/CCC1 transporter family protein, partial [Gemmobacter sp.]